MSVFLSILLTVFFIYFFICFPASLLVCSRAHACARLRSKNGSIWLK